PPTELHSLSLHDALPICQAALDGGSRMKATLEDLAAEAFGWPAGDVRLERDRFVSGQESASFDDVAARLGSGAPVEVSGVYAERSEEHTSELQSPDHLVC